MKSCFSVFDNDGYKAIQLKPVLNAHLQQIGMTLLVPLNMISRRYFVVCLGGIYCKILM